MQKLKEEKTWLPHQVLKARDMTQVEELARHMHVHGLVVGSYFPIALGVRPNI